MNTFTELCENNFRTNKREGRIEMSMCSRVISIIMLSIAGIAVVAAEDDKAAVRAEVDSAATAT